MKQLLIVLLIALACNVNGQYMPPEIKQHFRIMDSLWNIDQYGNMIIYAKAVEPLFKQHNSYPLYHYFNFLVNYLGIAYKENGQIEEAEKTMLESMSIIEAKLPRIHPSYNDAIYELGNLYMETGRIAKAYDLYTEAWKYGEMYSFWRQSRYIKLATNLINICAITGRFTTAEFYANKIEQSMPAYKYSNEALVDFNVNLSILYLQMLSVQKATLYINKANDLLAKTPYNIFTKTELNNSLALALMASGQKDTAEIIYRNLLTELERLNMKKSDGYYLAVMNLSNCYIVNDKNKKADSILTTVLHGTQEKRNKYIGGLYMTLALVKVKNTEYQMGLNYIDTAISIINENANDNLQYTLPAQILKSTFLLKVARNQEAFTVYENVLSSFTNNIKTNINHLSGHEKNNLLLSYYNMANFAQSFLTAEKQETKKNLTKKIWEQQLFFKGLAANTQAGFYEALRRNPDSSIRKQYDEWREMHDYIQTESQKHVLLRNKNIDSITLIAEKKEKQLMVFLKGKNKTCPELMVESIYKNLLPGEALIDFTHYSRITTALVDSLWYGAFILSYGNPSPAFVNICSEGALNKLINFPEADGPSDFQQNLLYPSSLLNKDNNLPGNRLYKLIWKPLLPFLKNIKKVYVVADGALYKIAFHVLPAENGGYVFERFDIRYLYHGSAITEPGFRDNSKIAGVQLWGGIRYDTLDISQNQGIKNLIKGIKAAVPGNAEKAEPDWNYLPGSAKETASIASLCKTKNIPCEIFSGTAATELAFKQNFGNNYAIVHIATHGRFDASYFTRRQNFNLFSNLPFTLLKDPMNQIALIMANRNILKNSLDGNLQEQDGLLNAGEIVKINSSEKRLVVLSACESGRGDIISAEGVYGMVRAFKMTGAKKVLISLWKVPDEQTKEMMLVFYKKLLAGTPESVSFKHAQQYMSKKYTPYYWGGFVLME